MRSIAAALAFAVCGCAAAAQTSSDPHPKTIDEFTAAVQNVLDETRVPGAGIALVRLDGVEWAGGVGYADRDARVPVTADTHFRAGSISKTFVAAALVQLYEDGDLDLDTPIVELASDIAVDNAWMITDPVRLIHVLQHTAGFDDMHFNETYNVSDPPDLPLGDVLRINPASRVVRWRPGTRFSYSNPGYTVAAYILERLTGQNYEDRIAEEIFKPVGMTTSSFHLRPEDHARLARGYSSATGPPVPYTQIYLRPSGNLHTSPADLGKFVHLLLNWGETPEDLVIDPEYLSNMEHPRTTLAAAAGLRNGYGTGLFSSFVEGFPMLGHNGGIEGFSSSFAYSTTRDVGYVVMLNSTHSPEAMRRIARLAVRYLKADVEPPAKPEEPVAGGVLRQYEGYYHPANPRNQAFAFLEWLLAGHTVSVVGNRLQLTPVFGTPSTLIPVSETLFRFEPDPEPTRVFTKDADGAMILTGGSAYFERRPRWRTESVRWPVLVSTALVLTPLIMMIARTIQRLVRRQAKREGGWLKFCLVCCNIAILLPAAGYLGASSIDLGARNLHTAAILAGTTLLPAAAILSFLATIDLLMSAGHKWLAVYGLVISVAALLVSAYLAAWGMLAFRPWSY